MKTYWLKGEKIINFDSFLQEFSTMVSGDGGYFGRNLFQFDDCLFGCGGLEYPCEILWENHQISQHFLNDKALALEYTKLLNGFKFDLEYDPDDSFSADMVEYYQNELNNIKETKMTLFDEIVACIKSVPERNQRCQIALNLC